jgi:phosphoglucomutase
MTPPAPLRFGTSGWRAVLADEFTCGNARRVVAAIARVLQQGGDRDGLVLVGFDTRFLARRFAEEAALLLREEGFTAEVAARPVPTPVLAFEIRRRGAAGGLNFTASHNPPQYLGIKFSTSDGAPALPEVTSRIEAEILAISERGAPEGAPVPSFEPVGPYLEGLGRIVDRQKVGIGRPSFSLDFRFGTSAGVLDTFLEGAGAELHRLHSQADPLFGGESPQCGEKELVRLGEEVRRHRSRLGLSCDGDADRFGVCDETGRYVSPNQILALLLDDMLGRKGRRGGVARSVATTHALDAVARHYGAPLFETPVGFKFIGEKLLAGEILFGGEESAGLTVHGHVPEKDGILADLLVAEMVGATGRSLTELSADLRERIGIFLTRRLDLELSEAARARLRQLSASPPDRFAGRTVSSVGLLDGIQLLLGDGSWILFRESGTEPVARVYVEASSEDAVRALAEAGRELLKR